MNSETFAFTFADERQLIAQLQQVPESLQTGFWEFRFSSPPSDGRDLPRYLGISQGRVIYAGAESPMSWPTFLDTLKRSLPNLRSSAARGRIQQVEKAVSPEQHALLGSMLSKLVSDRLLEYEDALRALRLNVLIALETILAAGSGRATFTTNYELVASAPIQGFEIESLLAEIAQRRTQWAQLKPFVPSMEGIPELDVRALQQINLPAHQKEQLERLVRRGKPLNQLTFLLGKDPLAIATTFAGLIQKKLVILKLPADSTPTRAALAPQVFIVDDSQLLIEQFQKLVTNWGYRVGYSNDALNAVEAIAKAKPDVIFLDINMPGASGFEVIKSIRRTPQIASVPLVLLTAETSVSNQWRAQWASCKFLAKPRTSAEVLTFREELQALLREVAPHSTEQLAQLQNRSLLLQTA